MKKIINYILFFFTSVFTSPFYTEKNKIIELLIEEQKLNTKNKKNFNAIQVMLLKDFFQKYFINPLQKYTNLHLIPQSIHKQYEEFGRRWSLKFKRINQFQDPKDTLSLLIQISFFHANVQLIDHLLDKPNTKKNKQIIQFKIKESQLLLEKVTNIEKKQKIQILIDSFTQHSNTKGPYHFPQIQNISHIIFYLEEYKKNDDINQPFINSSSRRSCSKKILIKFGLGLFLLASIYLLWPKDMNLLG